MPSPEDYHSRALELLPRGGSFTATNAAEAKALKKQITLIQKQLRQIKSEINLEIKTIRAEFQSRSATTKSRSTLLGILSGKRRWAGRLGAIDSQRAANARNDAIAPYEAVKFMIDELIIQLDSGKLQLDEALQTGDFD